MKVRKEYKLAFCHEFLEFTRIFILKLFKNQPQIAKTYISFLICTMKIIRDNSRNSWQTF